MKITDKEIVKQLQTIWPKLEEDKNVWLADSAYWMPDRKWIDELLKASWIDKKKYIQSTWDCDDYALYLMAEAHYLVAGLVWAEEIKKEDALPWAFGECWGYFNVDWNDIVKKHSINICITSDEGILLIEPQDDSIRIPDPKKDSIQYIRI